MGLTIYYGNGDSDEISVQSLSKVRTLLVSDVKRIEASGHEGAECLRIMRLIHGIDYRRPSPIGYVVHYYGDIARTILLNL